MKPKPTRRRCPGQVPISLDSGAHSLYTRYLAPKTVKGTKVKGVGAINKASFDYIKKPEFRKYLDDYLQYLKDHASRFTFAVTLDIIHNPEATWAVYKEMTGAGLRVIPVYHFGEDTKWLKKHMDASDYIGMGGMGQHNTKATYIPFGDTAWKIICDSKGKPLRKVHGFAMSSFDLMKRWPWFSVDSTSAFTFSRMGAIMLPQYLGEGRFNYSTTPYIFPTSEGRADHNRHISHLPPDGHIKTALMRYIEKVGVEEKEVMTHYVPRDICNLYFMNNLMVDLSRHHSERTNTEHKITYYASGNPTHSRQGGLATFEFLEERGATSHLSYLGTFFPGQRNVVEFFMRHWLGAPV